MSKADVIVARQPVCPPIRFDRKEWSGAFGDLGTDLPLLAAMVLVSGVNPASAFILFGLMQIFSAFVHRIPMPAQPLKVVAVIVIAGEVPAEHIFGAGLAIGCAMLVLTVTGMLDLIARAVPKAVIRGIQLGLGLTLAKVALGKYLPDEGTGGLVLAAIGFVVVLALLRHQRFPAAIAVLAVGVGYALIFKASSLLAPPVQGGTIAGFSIPSLAAIAQGAVLLALPQIPLSIGNSILATRQIAEDHFPEARIGIRRIGLSYSAMNLVSAPLGGIPVCHGSGGMAGHVAFGARTGGSVIIYGVFMMAIGAAHLAGFPQVLLLFPLPILGVILFVEAVALVRLMRDLAFRSFDWTLAAAVGMTALLVPNGFLVGIVGGSVLFWLRARARRGGHRLRRPGVSSHRGARSAKALASRAGGS